MRFKKLSIAITAVLLFAGLFATNGKAEPEVIVTIKDPPEVIRHCQPYRMTIEAKCPNPSRTMEKFKKSIVWDIQPKGKLFNPQTNKYDIKKVPGHFENQAEFGLHAVPHPWRPLQLTKPQGKITGSFTATWNVCQYRRKKDNAGAEGFVFYSHFDRGSFFRTPGAWEVLCSATMTITIDKKEQTLKGSDNFPVLVFPPQLHVYAVGGVGGVLAKLSKGAILKDHLQINILDKLPERKNPDYVPYPHHIVQSSEILKPLADNTECGVYMDNMCGCNKIAFIGYGCGGHELIKFAEKMRDGYSPTFSNIPAHAGKFYPKQKFGVDLLITIDPVHQLDFEGIKDLPDILKKKETNKNRVLQKQANVKRHVNFYQQIDVGSLDLKIQKIKAIISVVQAVYNPLDGIIDGMQMVKDVIDALKGLNDLKDTDRINVYGCKINGADHEIQYDAQTLQPEKAHINITKKPQILDITIQEIDAVRNTMQKTPPEIQKLYDAVKVKP